MHRRTRTLITKVGTKQETPRHLQQGFKMKYGEHLKANISSEYGKEAYLNYNELDDCIRELAADAPSRYVSDVV